ncbi:uncharacterized protein A1O9_04340 [Exophiala aquamarina CBS 119918]|uniref:Transcription factor domain-containing protein n=1 Tax=Exophiala aquamarina CBS 119918 TaxID=1182545 RepID=A0A072PHY8_9EURO|nr:uncharacterized protein A1O9_04340 [Exophiala aquamarina CBS 119918]KEF59496.1 hypothetical protein A1O9_04340 [Exophiala aquamarina CBS 119918]
MAQVERSCNRKPTPQPDRYVKVEKDAACAVCRRPGCRLQSHQTYLTHRRRATKELVNSPIGKQQSAKDRVPETAYASSYAFTRDASPSTTPSPHGIGSGRLNGFSDLPVPGGHRTDLHHAVYSVLNFKIGAATAFPLPSGLAVNDIGGAMIIPVMTDTSLCLSVIAAWQAVQCLAGQLSSDTPYLSYEAKALQSLRNQLVKQGNAGISDEAIMAAALLWATSTLFAQPEPLQRHANGVKAMVTVRGGLDTLGHAGAIKQLILWADFLTAQFLADDVRFRDIGAIDVLPPALSRLHKSISIPKPFNQLRPETVKAAADLRLLLVSHDRALKTGRISIPEYKALMSLLNQSTVDRLGLAKEYQGQYPIDECVITAMNLLRLTVLFHAAPLYSIVVSVIERLRDLVSDGGPRLWTNFLDTFIWVCFVGLVNQFETHNRFHFTDMISKALTVKYKSDWPDDWQAEVLLMLRSFLWSEAVLTDLYFDMCQMIESHIISPGSTI